MTLLLSILSPPWIVRPVLSREGTDMAKGQKRSNREVRKPKAAETKAAATTALMFQAARSRPR